MQPKKKPTALDRQATVFAAEQNLKPWELPKQKPGKRKAEPVSSNARYKAAVAAPASADAREFLAQTLTPERRRQYQEIIQPPSPKPDRGLLHSLLGAPEAVYHHLATPHLMQTELTQGAKAVADKEFGGPYLGKGPLGGVLPTRQELTDANKQLVGHALYNAVTQGQTSHLAAAGLETAALLPPVKAVKLAAAVAKAGEGAKLGREAALTAFESETPLLGKGTVEAARRSVALRGVPERAQTHQAIDAMFGRKTVIARQVKDQVDAHAHLHVFDLPKGERKAAAATAYREILDKLPKPTGEQSGQQIVGGMGQATRLRREQEALRHLERGVRARAAAKAMEETPGEAGHIAALQALKGPMPTLKWDRFEHFDQDAIDAMIAHIRAHPSLQGLNKTYTRLNTEGALLSIVQGNLPRKFEQKLLRNVFGDATDRLLASVPFWKKAKAVGMNLVGVPRTLLASFDLSAPLRQGLTFGISHPALWGKNFAPMVKSFGSPRVFEQTMEQIASRPSFDLMQKAGVPFTDLGGALSHREEMFMSNFAERIPVVGKVVQASNRAYVAFLNKSRADYFDWLLERAAKTRPELDLEGPQGEKLLKAFARVVGNATGRGTVKNDTLAKALPALNQILFAPRLLKSRLDVFNPAYYVSLDPLARREAFKHLAGLAGTVGGVLALAKLAGAKVQMDPRNADWAKVRVGNTRFDIAGGFQQPLRLVAQVGSGKIISSTSGKTLNLGAGGGYGHLTKLDILARFGETKLAPPPSLVLDFFRGSDFQGKPFSWKLATYQRVTPLLAQDAIDLYRQGDSTAGNIAAATALYGIGMWGVGAQTYGPKKPKPPPGPSDPFSSGSNPFMPSGGSSNPFMSP